jgi:hypothetical protein
MMMFPSFLMMLMIHALIDVGVVFSDVDQCQRAVQHWCIVNDYAYHTIKKDKGRFRANCLRASTCCKWLFFTSTSRGDWVQGKHCFICFFIPTI